MAFFVALNMDYGEFQGSFTRDGDKADIQKNLLIAFSENIIVATSRIISRTPFL